MSEHREYDLLGDLLDDAKLIASYSQRTGRLKDPKLLDIIAKVDKLPSKSWNDKSVIELQLGINKAVQSIYPTTLRDLKTGWHPNGYFVESFRKIFVFGFLSIFLMSLAAIYTVNYSVGTIAVTRLEAIKSGNVEANLLSTMWKILAYATSPDAPRSTAYGDKNELYFNLINDVRAYNSQLDEYTNYASAFIASSDDPVDWVVNFTSAELTKIGARKLSEKDQAILTAFEQGSIGEANPCPSPGTSVGVTQVADKGGSDIVTELKDYEPDLTLIACLAEKHGKVMPPLNLPNVDQLLTMSTERVNNLALWALPAIYGALGASVYYMRRIVDPTIPDPSWPRIIYRITLGAFSGIIISWFWSPASHPSANFADVSLNVFSIAFIFGFSVEIFFTFLDRMVLLATNWIKQIGPSKTQTN